MTTLRELAQAVVDGSRDGGREGAGVDSGWASRSALRDALLDARHNVDARAILAALDAEREAPKWQPIETAPIDGVDRLVCTEGGSYYIACLYAEDGWLTDDDGPERQVYPTHWQPLPAPPEVTAQREGAEGDE